MTLRLAATTALLPALALAPAEALPCGAMVFPGHGDRVGGMSDQELLVAFAEDRTVLVASAGYEGIDAADFAFLLPLAQSPADVRDADPALFIALDEQTAPRVSITLDEGDRGSGGCATLSNDGGVPNGLDDGGGVMVDQRGTTATYEWVVIGGDTGDAVADWLADEGYTLPPDYAAAIDPYVTDGWFFFAAKVRPEASDGDLAAIELQLPPSMPDAFQIPLGIAAHSLAPDQPLRLTTYIWSDGEVVPANYAASPIPAQDLVALDEEQSNYPELEQEALASDPEGAWIIDYAAPTSLEQLHDAYGLGLDFGRVDPSTSDGAFLDDFFGRLGTSEGHVTRLRTELAADQLRDLQLQRSEPLDVTHEYRLVYEEDSSRCAVGRGGRLPGALVLLPIAAWIRPRRRRSSL